MGREEHGPGDDQRVLIFLANFFPVRRVGKQPFVGLEIFLFLDLDGQRHRLLDSVVLTALPVVVRTAPDVADDVAGRPVLVLGDVDERQDVGVDDP